MIGCAMMSGRPLAGNVFVFLVPDFGRCQTKPMAGKGTRGTCWSLPQYTLQFFVFFVWAAMLVLGMELRDAVADAIQPVDLHCEFRTDPCGIDVARPLLSWLVSSDQRNQKQSAYQIQVATSIDQLREEGHVLRSINQRKQSLENVFLKLTSDGKS